MKTTLILVGRTADKLYTEGIADYAQRVGHYMPFEVKVIPELRNNKNMSEQQQKDKEGELILKNIEAKDYVVLLDEHGRQFRSIEFARWVGGRQQAGQPLTFVIGGPYGFSEAVYQRADFKISLSPMTFSHQMVRLIFVEQLYRACTIMRGEPYHHE